MTMMLPYFETGRPDGEPVLLIHAGVFGAWFAPLAEEPALQPFRVIRVLRTGYTGEPSPDRIVTMAEHAAQAAELLDALGVAQARVVGHSSGTLVALHLAADRPDLVGRLVLSEPPLLDPLVAPEDREAVQRALGPVLGRALQADPATAFDLFMSAVCGPDYRSVLTSVLGSDGVAKAERESAFFFGNEVPASGDWSFEPVAGVKQPAVVVRGEDSPPAVHRLVAHVAGLLEHGSVATVPGAGHLLPLTHPAQLAAIVAAGPGRA